MNNTSLEKTLEQKAVFWLESFPHVWCIKVGQTGWPDRLVILGNGNHFWLELKRERGGRLTRAQERRFPKLRAGGEKIYIAKTMDDVAAAFYLECP